MKPKINLAEAAEAESFGALAIGRRRFRHKQGAATSTLIHYLLEMVREAGAEKRWVRAGRLSLRLHSEGRKKVLSVRE